jgi:DNA helicase IV
MSNQHTKEELVGALRSSINDVRILVDAELARLKTREEELLSAVSRSFSMEQELAAQQLNYCRRRVDELASLSHSPFFAKVVYTSDNEIKNVYISKYEFIASDVSSWTTPIAELRFEALGDNIINLPGNITKDINLSQKDNYVINDDKIIYYSQETRETGIEIIYEDFLSNIKSEYGLSEIISKIEKEQYKIIQSKYNIPLIVSGPAGSGKTTICLHRISYLLQTPETADKYAGENMLMLVQDKSTKEYFSSILPKLGIPNMYVYTYFEWACSILEINNDDRNITEVNLYNIDERYLNLLRAKVNLISKNKIKQKKFGTDPLIELDKIYKKYLSVDDYTLYSTYKNKNLYDYLDMTIVLMMVAGDDGLCREDEVYRSLGESKYKLEKKRRKISYGLVMVDEFQNYSDDQINIIKKVINPKTNSLVYIGDMNQKSMVRPSSTLYLNNYNECHRVVLDKVYRNTKNILEYIKGLGYDIVVPDKARAGKDVESYEANNLSDLPIIINKVLDDKSENETIGILFDNDKIMNDYKASANQNGNVRLMTKIESQGTEFNTVISIDSDNLDTFTTSAHSEEFISLKRLAKKNANYIGYTRAVENLIVIKI